MKTIFLSFLCLLSGICALAQAKATNFTVNDCSGTSHDLFSDLDAGKVVVMVWVMPCGACIGPALSAYSVVQKYGAQYPGRVLFYLADDSGNTTCATLKLWAKTNDINTADVFSNPAINMADYGDPGMPKIVAMTGPGHQVIFNQNNAVDVTVLNTAITRQLTTGMDENTNDFPRVTLFPNPASGSKATLRYHGNPGPDLKIDMFNSLGIQVNNKILVQQFSKRNEIDIRLELLSNGLYFIKTMDGDQLKIIKLIVDHK